MSPDCFRKCGRQLELGLRRWRNEGLGCYKLLSYNNDQHHLGYHFSRYNINTQSREIGLRIILMKINDHKRENALIMNHILSANCLRKSIKFSLENFMWKLN